MHTHQNKTNQQNNREQNETNRTGSIRFSAQLNSAPAALATTSASVEVKHCTRGSRPSQRNTDTRPVSIAVQSTTKRERDPYCKGANQQREQTERQTNRENIPQLAKCSSSKHVRRNTRTTASSSARDALTPPPNPASAKCCCCCCCDVVDSWLDMDVDSTLCRAVSSPPGRGLACGRGDARANVNGDRASGDCEPN